MCVGVLTLTLNICVLVLTLTPTKNVFWFWTLTPKMFSGLDFDTRDVSGFDLNSNSNTFWFCAHVELPGNV